MSIWSSKTSTSGWRKYVEARMDSISVGAASELSDLTDVNTSTATDKHLLIADGVDWESRRMVNADLSDPIVQLDDLSDVSTAGTTAKFALLSDGAAYVGRAILEADINDHRANAATFASSVLVQGAFTSKGIDDNASGERLQINDISVILGTTSADFTVAMSDNGQTLAISGGSGSANGANILFDGGAHATTGDMLFRNDGRVWMQWDEIAGDLEILTGVGVKTSALTIAANQDVTWGSGGMFWDDSLHRLTVGDGSVSNTLMFLNSSVTGSPSIQWEQNSTAKAFIQYVDSGDIFEIDSDGTIELHPNNTKALTLDTGGDATFEGDIKIPATQKLWFDGGGNTWIRESSADNLSFVTGGTEALRIDSSQNVFIANGTFTSLGIDDNTNGERLQLENSKVTFGTTGATFDIVMAANDQTNGFSGGSSTVSGAVILMSGGAHANTGDMRFNNDANTWMLWDESVGDLEILTGVGAKTAAMTLDASQNVTINNGVLLGTAIVDTTQIAADAIDSTKLADNAVNSEHYVDGSIDNAHIADNAINSEHYAAGSIDNEHIADNAVNSEHYAAGSIDLEHMAANSVDSPQYVDGSIDAIHIATGTITVTQMGANSVDSSELVDGSIDLSHMSSNSVDSAQYVNGSIDNAHIADNAINSEHYAAASIDNEHIADNAVGLAEMAHGTDGNLITYSTSGAPVAVATGASGQLLTANGTGTVPTWETPSGGAGNVSNTGTPVNGELAVWTDATTIEGDRTAIIDRTMLKTTTSAVSSTSTTGVNVTMAGGNYQFFPRTHTSSGVLGNEVTIEKVTNGNSYVTRVWIKAGNISFAMFARSTYIQSSPPYDLGDGEIPLFIFVEVTPSGRIVSCYEAPEAPWHYNGPTNIIPSRYDGTGKSFRTVRDVVEIDNAMFAAGHARGLNYRSAKAASPDVFLDYLDALSAAQKIEVELTQEYKNADMDLLPHPFEDAEPANTVVLLDPVSPLTQRLFELKDDDEFDVCELLHDGDLIVDNTVLTRFGPPGVDVVSYSFR